MKFVNRFVLVFTLPALFMGCDSTTSSEGLVGAWGYINHSDSTYDEIYFTKEFLVHNFASIGIRGVDEYLLSNDSVYLLPGRVYYLNILKAQESKLWVRNLDGDEFIMERLSIPDNSFRSFCIPDGRRMELQKGRILRGAEVLYENGLRTDKGVNEDTFITIPPTER